VHWPDLVTASWWLCVEDEEMWPCDAIREHERVVEGNVASSRPVPAHAQGLGIPRRLDLDADEASGRPNGE
jgi:hypothetical protein